MQLPVGTSSMLVLYGTCTWLVGVVLFSPSPSCLKLFSCLSLEVELLCRVQYIIILKYTHCVQVRAYVRTQSCLLNTWYCPLNWGSWGRTASRSLGMRADGFSIYRRACGRFLSPCGRLLTLGTQLLSVVVYDVQSLGGPIQHLLSLWISARCTFWFDGLRQVITQLGSL